MAASVARNSTFNVSAQVISLAGNLVVTPIFVHALGPVDYGKWAILLAISGTASGLDLGLSVAVARAIPEQIVRRNYERIASLLAAAGLFYVLLAATSGLLALAVTSFIGEMREHRDLAIVAAAVFTSSSFAALARALLQGSGRFDLSAGLTIAGFSLFWTLGATTVSAGGGVAALGLAMVLMFVMQAAVGGSLALMLEPRLRAALRTVRVDMSVWQYLFGFGGQIQVSYLADIVKNNGPRLLAAAMFGAAVAGVYDIGARMANAAWSIPAALLPAIIPAASAAHARNDSDALAAIYVRATTSIVTLALPLGLGLAITANLLVPLWVGRGYEASAFVLMCLAIGNILHLATGGGTFVARGVGRSDLEVKYQLVTMTLYAAVGAVMSLIFGFVGIPLTVALVSGVGAAYFTFRIARRLRVPLSVLVMSLRTAVVASLLASLLALVALRVSNAMAEGPSLVLVSLTFAAAYVAPFAIVALNRVRSERGRSTSGT